LEGSSRRATRSISLVWGTFRKMGYRNVKWLSFDQVKSVSREKRERWLGQVERRFASLAA